MSQSSSLPSFADETVLHHGPNAHRWVLVGVGCVCAVQTFRMAESSPGFAAMYAVLVLASVVGFFRRQRIWVQQDHVHFGNALSLPLSDVDSIDVVPRGAEPSGPFTLDVRHKAKAGDHEDTKVSWLALQEADAAALCSQLTSLAERARP